jgi:hypothetical protein
MNSGSQVMPRCYIVQDLGKINFLPAEQHGELVIVVEGRVNHTSLKRTFAAMKEKMRGITKQDWIIACGNPALIALAGAIMAQRCGCVRILSWDQQAQQYTRAEVPA